MKKRQPIAVLALCAAAVLLFWPSPYLASPHWEVWVTRPDGTPIEGINVALYFHNFSTEEEGHTAILTTDSHGYVVFPPHYQKASIAQYVFHTVSAARAGVHASFGRHASVFAYGNGYEGWPVTGEYVTDWRGSPSSMQSKIAAKLR